MRWVIEDTQERKEFRELFPDIKVDRLRADLTQATKYEVYRNEF